jgi:hypothetical protein
VSSFSSLVKGKGFILIFSPHLGEMGVALLICVALWAAALVAHRPAAEPLGSLAANDDARSQ